MRVAIAGGGISGLSCAHYLQSAGVEAVVFDPAPGGPMGTETVEGCLLETGPESWLAAKPWAEQLIREIGLGGDLVGSNDAKRRTYVLRGGRFIALPEGLQMVVPTRILPVLETPLFGWGTKLRMGAEIFRSPKLLPDRSVAEFVRDHFGEEAVDYLAEPLLAGVYGGSPDQLSVASVLPRFFEYEQRYGSVVVGALRNKPAVAGGSIFRSLRRGMGSLIEALLAPATLVRARVESIAPDAAGGWMVFAESEWIPFDAVVLACGANQSAPLVGPLDARAAELLAGIPYTGNSIWTFIYDRASVKHPLDGFGFLVPWLERNAIMACTWVGTKWVGRVPEDKAVLRCFSTDLAARREVVESDLARLMHISAAPLAAINHRWPDSMPQYTVGHMTRIAELEARIAQIPRLFLAGNAFHGIGIPDCVKSGRDAAAAIATIS
ncbi:MAG TPA: protoporphyrinogen oxidase [Bryobacteraceae bacterium]|nr:protoporphyrinogen oxidase [Bryobacteraceae bacterium]